MPKDYRITDFPLPANLEKGKYVATFLLDYGDENAVEMAELTFTYE